MLFFGWGSKTKEWAPNPTTRLVVAYSYAHIMFVFTAAWGPEFLMGTWTEQGWAWRQITREEATVLNAGITPDIHPWWKYSLAGTAGLLVVVSIFVALLSATT